MVHIDDELLRKNLESCTHGLLPEARKDFKHSTSEAEMVPLAVLSIAASLKRIADELTVLRTQRSS